jgi:PAS domain-containing protein
VSAIPNTPTDLVLGLCVGPGKTGLRTGLMLARVLGYPPDELNGKWLQDLMSIEEPAASEVVAALLDEEDVRPFNITLRCKDERRKSFRLHRRFDPYDHSLFVLADELD